MPRWLNPAVREKDCLFGSRPRRRRLPTTSYRLTPTSSPGASDCLLPRQMPGNRRCSPPPPPPLPVDTATAVGRWCGATVDPRLDVPPEMRARPLQIVVLAWRRGPCAPIHRAAGRRLHLRAARGRQPPVPGVIAPDGSAPTPSSRSACLRRLRNHRDECCRGRRHDSRRLCGVLAVRHGRQGRRQRRAR